MIGPIQIKKLPGIDSYEQWKARNEVLWAQATNEFRLDHLDLENQDRHGDSKKTTPKSYVIVTAPFATDGTIEYGTEVTLGPYGSRPEAEKALIEVSGTGVYAGGLILTFPSPLI